MNRIGRLAEVSDAVWLPHLAVLLMECECDLAPRSAPIEGPVIGLKAVTGTERENEPFPSLRGCQRVGSQNVVFIGDLAPGAVATRHYHPGDEAIYMLEGALRFAPDHEQPFELKAGEITFNPATHIHQAKNESSTASAKVLNCMIAEKGQPLAIAAQ